MVGVSVSLSFPPPIRVAHSEPTSVLALCFSSHSGLTFRLGGACGNTGKAEAVAKSINDNGGKAVAVPGDMLDAAYVDELVKKSAAFGKGKIHIIVNNAGFTWDGVIHKVTQPFLSLLLGRPPVESLLQL